MPSQSIEEIRQELKDKWDAEPSDPVITPVRKIMVRSAPGDAIRAHLGLKKPQPEPDFDEAAFMEALGDDEPHETENEPDLGTGDFGSSDDDDRLRESPPDIPGLETDGGEVSHE